MPTLVYRRTHTGDPSKAGIFGVRDCMGTKCQLWFDSVIGIGGIGARPKGIISKARLTGLALEAAGGRMVQEGPVAGVRSC